MDPRNKSGMTMVVLAHLVTPLPTTVTPAKAGVHLMPSTKP
jgi:hypothetical protein